MHRPVAGSGHAPHPGSPARSALFVGIEARGRADVVLREAAAQEQFGGLAAGGAVFGGDGAKTAPDEVAGVVEPIALEAVHRGGDGFTGEAMGRQFGADPQRAVAGARAAADQLLGETGVILPAGGPELVDGGHGGVRFDAAGWTFVPQPAPEATDVQPIAFHLTGVQVGGTALRVESEELEDIRHDLAEAYRGLLIPQDQAPWRPHVTLQNNVEPREARRLQQQLRATLEPRPLTIKGLASWRYLGGPWEPIRTHMFRG